MGGGLRPSRVITSTSLLFREVYALNARTGQEIWSDIVPSLSPSTGRLQLEVSDIQALTVLDRSVLFVVSNGGRTMAYDSMNGRLCGRPMLVARKRLRLDKIISSW